MLAILLAVPAPVLEILRFEYRQLARQKLRIFAKYIHLTTVHNTNPCPQPYPKLKPLVTNQLSEPKPPLLAVLRAVLYNIAIDFGGGGEGWDLHGTPDTAYNNYYGSIVRKFSYNILWLSYAFHLYLVMFSGIVLVYRLVCYTLI